VLRQLATRAGHGPIVGALSTGYLGAIQWMFLFFSTLKKFVKSWAMQESFKAHKDLQDQKSVSQPFYIHQPSHRGCLRPPKSFCTAE